MTIRDDVPVVWVHTIDDVRVGALGDVLELEIDERLQSSHTATLTINAADVKASLVDIDRILQIDDVCYRIKEAETVRDGQRTLMTVTAEALWCDLLNGLFTDPQLSGTIRDGLERILEINGWLGDWSAGSVESDGGAWVLDYSGLPTTWAAIRQWAALVGREVVVDTVARTVSFVLEQGDDTGRTFRYGRDVTEVTRTIEPPEVTRLYALGKDDLTFASVNGGVDFIEDLSYYIGQGYSAELAERFGRHALWVAPEYSNATQLYDAAVARLATLAQPRVAYRLAVTDLAELTGVASPVKIGDTVRVVDLDLGVNVETRVVRVVRRPFEPSADTIELSYLTAGLELGGGTSVVSGGGGGGAGLEPYSTVNANAFTINTSVTTPNAITLTLASATDLVCGYQVVGTASGSGTVAGQLFWGTEPAGAEVRVPFTTGPFTLTIAQPLQGVDGSRNLNARVYVQTGTGSVSVGVGASSLYVLAGNAAGTGNADPSYDLNEPVDTTANLHTITETVTITNPP